MITLATKSGQNQILFSKINVPQIVSLIIFYYTLDKKTIVLKYKYDDDAFLYIKYALLLDGLILLGSTIIAQHIKLTDMTSHINKNLHADYRWSHHGHTRTGECTHAGGCTSYISSGCSHIPYT